MEFASLQSQTKPQELVLLAPRRASHTNPNVGMIEYEGDMLEHISEHSDVHIDTRVFCSPDDPSSLDSKLPTVVDCIPFDFSDHSDPNLPFGVLGAAAEEQSLQVDHNGIRVSENASTSTRVPAAIFSDKSPGTFVPSSVRDYSHCSAKNASVFAAAITAAMIMDRGELVPKRPRSAASESVSQDDMQDDQVSGSEMDYAVNDSTEAASDYSEDVPSLLCANPQGSPRSVMESNNLSKLSSSESATQSFAQPVVLLSETTVPKPSSEPADMRVREEDTGIDNAPAARLKRKQITPSELPKNDSLVEVALHAKRRRAEAMERFRRKKAVRCYGRRVRYQIRKRIATTRPRVNGRFARRVDSDA